MPTPQDLLNQADQAYKAGNLDAAKKYKLEAEALAQQQTAMSRRDAIGRAGSSPLPDRPPTAPGFAGMFLRIKAVSEAVEHTTNKLRENADAASAAKNAIDSVPPLSSEERVDKVVASHPELQALAQSEVGGYLDQIAKIVAALNDPKNAYNVWGRAQGETDLRNLGAMLQKFDKFFDVDRFRSMLEETTVSAIKKVAKAATSGTGTGGFTMGQVSQPSSDASLSTLISTGVVRG